MLDLSTCKILKYDTMLEELTLFDFKNFKLSSDNLYFIQQKSNRLGRLSNLYIKLEPISFHYESYEGKKWSIATILGNPKTVPKALAFIRFKILGVFYSKEKLNSKSRLKGFNRIIDDNHYFSSIPIINDLVHLDNGVITTHNFKTYVYGFKDELASKIYTFPDGTKETAYFLKDWSSYQISCINDFKGKPVLTMAGEDGHTTL